MNMKTNKFTIFNTMVFAIFFSTQSASEECTFPPPAELPVVPLSTVEGYGPERARKRPQLTYEQRFLSTEIFKADVAFIATVKEYTIDKTQVVDGYKQNLYFDLPLKIKNRIKVNKDYPENEFLNIKVQYDWLYMHDLDVTSRHLINNHREYGIYKTELIRAISSHRPPLCGVEYLAAGNTYLFLMNIDSEGRLWMAGRYSVFTEEFSEQHLIKGRS